MAILEMIGFEGFPPTTVNQTVLALAGKGLLASVNGNFTPEVVNGRTRLGIAAGTTNIGFNWSWVTSMAEMKRVKHWGGFRYQQKATAAAGYALLRIRFQYATSSVSDFNVLLTTALSQAGYSQTSEVYIEYCIDLANYLISVWMDGVKQPDVPLTPQNVVDTVRDIEVWHGQTISATLQTWNDFYFVKDTSDVDGGSTLSRRLGPVRVRASFVNAVELPAGWSVTGGGAAPAALDPKTLNNATTPVVRTASDESVAKIGFAKPNPTWDIQAISIREWHFRDSGTTPVLVTQLKQGETLLPPVTNTANVSTPRTGSAADKLGVFNRALDGTAWTADKVDQLEILVNSKTGS